MSKIILIAHNIRSTHNVGSLLRTADCLGVSVVYLTGYTPYPAAKHDKRLPHLVAKLSSQIHKTALGAEMSTKWAVEPDIMTVIKQLKSKGLTVVALEQASGSISLPEFVSPREVAVIVGNEVTGLEPEILKSADKVVEIPMSGKKESLNVVQASAICLYHLKFVKNSLQT